MNRIFKTIWSRKQNRIVVVSENKKSFAKGAKSGSQTTTSRKPFIFAQILLAATLNMVWGGAWAAFSFPSLSEDDLLEAGIGLTATSDEDITSTSYSGTGANGTKGADREAGTEHDGESGTSGKLGIGVKVQSDFEQTIFQNLSGTGTSGTGGAGGKGAAGGYRRVTDKTGYYSALGYDGGNGGISGEALGVYIQAKSATQQFLGTISGTAKTSSGGVGGHGGDGIQSSNNSGALMGGDGGKGGGASTSIGVFIDSNSSSQEFNGKITGSATGGNGGLGGSGGMGAWGRQSTTTSTLISNGGNGGRGGKGGDGGEAIGVGVKGILGAHVVFNEAIDGTGMGGKGGNGGAGGNGGRALNSSYQAGNGHVGGNGGHGGNGYGVAFLDSKSSLIVFNGSIIGKGTGGTAGTGGKAGSKGSVGTTPSYTPRDGTSGSKGYGYGVYLINNGARYIFNESVNGTGVSGSVKYGISIHTTSGETYFNNSIIGKAQSFTALDSAVIAEVVNGALLAFSGEIKSEGGKIEVVNRDSTLIFSNKIPDLTTDGSVIGMTGENATTVFDFGSYNWETSLGEVPVMKFNAETQQELQKKQSVLLSNIFPEITNGTFEEIKQDLASGLSFSAGTLKLRNLNITSEQKEELEQKIKGKFSNIEVVFDEGVSFSKGGVLDVPLVNALYDSSEDFRNITYATLELFGFGTVVVGSQENALKHNTGFKGIKSAVSTLIQDGYKLELVGQENGYIDATSGYAMTDAPITVSNGTLMLGSKGTGETYGGRLEQIDLSGSDSTLNLVTGLYGVNTLTLGENSNLNIQDGKFVAENVTSELGGTITNAGTMSLTNGTATIANLSNNGAFDVAGGTFTINALSGTGTFNVQSSKTPGTINFVEKVNTTGQIITNGGTINFQEDVTLGSKFTNESSLVVDNKLYFEGAGQLVQESADASIEFADVTNVFQKTESAFDIVGLGTEQQEEAKKVESSTFKSGLTGDLNEDFVSHSELTGGTVKIKNVTATAAQQNQLKSAFSTKYGQDVTLEFVDPVDSADQGDVLSAATVNKLYNEKADFQNVTFINDTLKGLSTEVIVGNSEGNLQHSTGFRGVEGATSITINDGLTLELIGKDGETAYDMTGGAGVTVAQGTLTLGSKGVGETYAGKLASVSLTGDSSKLNLATGKYAIDALTFGDNASAAINGGELTVSALTTGANATLTNAGTAHLNSTTANFASIANTGTMELLTGTYTINSLTGTGSLSLENGVTANIENTTSATFSRLTNKGNLTAGDVHLTGAGTNTGTLHVKGNLTVDDSLTQTEGTLDLDKSNIVFSSLSSYDYVPIKVITKGAEGVEQAKSVNSDNFKRLVSGILDSTFAEKVAVNGGKVVLQNTNLSTEQMADLQAIFQAKYTGATLEFGSNTEFDYHSNTTLDVATVNKLYDEKSDFQNVTFVEDTLKAGGSALVVGTSGLKNSTGFKGIENATAVTIQDNLNLELIGSEGDESFDLAGGAGVTVTQGALTLGSKAVGDEYKGKLTSVFLTGQSSEVSVVAGKYSLDTLTLGENASVKVKGGELVAKALTTGTTSLLDISGTARLGTTSATLSQIVNNGTLDLTNGQFTLNTISGSGNLTLQDGATATLLDATGATNQHIINAGTLNVDNAIVVNNIENTGTMKFANTVTFGAEGKYKQSGSAAVGDFVNAASVLDLTTRSKAKFELVKVGAQAQQEINSTESDSFKSSLAGLLNTDFADHAELTGGVIKVENAPVNVQEQDYYKNTFAQKYAGVQLEFVNATADADADILNTATVNKMYDSEEAFKDVTFVNMTLKAEGADVTVGNSEGNLKHSTGFKGIDNATAINVNDGLSLELVGENNDSANFVMAAVKTIVNAASKLVLGSKAFEGIYSGKTAEVELNGDLAQLVVAAGNYDVEKVSGAGTVTVEKGGKLTVNGGEFAGNSDVKGTLQVKGEGSLANATLEGESLLSALDGTYEVASLTGAGNIGVENDATLTLKSATHTGSASVKGNLKVDGTGSIGNATLEDSSTLTALSGDYEAASVGGAGTLDVEQGAQFTVKGGSHTGLATVKGTLELDGTGSLGQTSLEADSKLLASTGQYQAQTVEGSGKIEVVNGAALTVAGGEHTGEADVKGNLKLAGTGKLGATTLGESSSLTAQSGSYEVASVTGNGTIGVDSGATMKLKASEHTGSATVDGTLELDGNDKIGTTTVQNQGVVLASTGQSEAQSISGNGKIDVAKGAQLTLKGASHTGEVAVKGTLAMDGTGAIGQANVENDATLLASTGQFEVASATGTGKIQVEDAAKLTLKGGTHTGEAVINGTLQTDGTGSLGTTTLGGSATLLANSGTYTAQSLDGSGKIDVTNGANLTLLGGEHTGNADVKGTLALNGEGKVGTVTLQDASSLHATGGSFEVASVTGSGSIVVDNSSELTLDAVNQTGSVNLNGKLILNADSTLGNATLGRGSEIENNNNLHLASIVSSDGAVYRQTGGSLTTDSGWFMNSTLYISGGKLEYTDIAGGSREGLGLGNNTIEISGKGKNPVIKTESSAESKANWKDKLTVVHTDVLKSESKVTVQQGGVLLADKLDFDGSTENSLVLAGGALETSLDQVFEGVTRDYLDIDAENMEGQLGKPTHVLGATTVGKLKDSVKKGIQGNSGIVVFNDEYVKMEGIVKAMVHFAAEASHPGSQESEHPDTPLDSSDGVYLAFSGQVDARLTVDLANKFNEEQVESGAIAGVVLSHTTLYNEQSGHDKNTYKDLVIGYNEHHHPDSNVIDVDHGIGFLSVEGADTVHIEDGKEFVLVGHHDDDQIRTDEQREHVHSVDDKTLFNENTALIKNENNDGGKVEVTGKFTFGSFAAHTSTVGWIGEIEIHEKGQVETKNGEYAVWNIENEGTIHVDKGTVLHSHNYSGNGSWVNEGQIYLGNDHEEHSGLESQPFEIKGKFQNATGAILSTEKKSNLLVDNELNNEGVGLYSVLTVNEGGISKNNGIETGTNIDVKTEGKHAIGSDGQSYFKKADVAGTLENSGNLVFGKGLVMEASDLVPDSSDTGEKGLEVALGGELTNKNFMDATAIEEAKVSGTYNNSGKAQFAKLHLNEGAVASNEGTEVGTELAVDTDAKVTIGEHGITQYKKGSIAGAIENHGKLIFGVDPNGEPEPEPEPEVEHEAEPGPQGDQGAMAQASSVNEVPLGDEDESAGSGPKEEEEAEPEVPVADPTKGFTLEEGGELENHGLLDASRVATSYIKGKLQNIGQAQYKDVEVQAGGDEINTGTSVGETLTVQTDGKWTNKGTAKYNSINGNGGTINFGGTAEVGEFNLTSGNTLVTGGSTVIGKAALNGGTLSIGNELETATANTARIVFKAIDPVSSTISIGKNGDMIYGEGGLALVEKAEGFGVANTTPRLVVSGNFTTNQGSSLTVGNPTTRAGALTDGSLYFAADSLTVIDASETQDKAAFSTKVDGATLTVEEGAKLTIGNLKQNGTFLVSEGFTNTNYAKGHWDGGWSGEGLAAFAEGSNERLWDLTLHTNENAIWLEAKLHDMNESFPDVPVVPGDLGNIDPNAGGDTKFLYDVLLDPNLTDQQKQDIVNSVTDLGSVGGSMSAAFGTVNSASSATSNRTSGLMDSMGYGFGGDYGFGSGMDGDSSYGMNGSDGANGMYGSDSEGRGGDGSDKDATNGGNGDNDSSEDATAANRKNRANGNDLWFDYLGGWQRQKDLKSTGISSGYKAHSFGAIVGYDHIFYDQHVLVGGAVSYDSGKLDSTGQALASRNEFKTYGAQLYAGWRPLKHLNVIGALGLMRSESDISMNLGGVAGYKKATANAKSTHFLASTMVESPFTFGQYGTVAPHIGVSLMVSKTGDYWTKLDGRKAFKNHLKTTKTVQVPIGVGYRKEFKFDNGWKVQPNLDLSVIPQLGDTKQKAIVSGASQTSVTSVSGEFTGRFGYSVNVGIKATDKKDWSIGFNYGYTGGSKGRSDHALKLEAKWRF